MTTIHVRVDDRTEAVLRELGERDGSDVQSVAARLLVRAVRSARPRPRIDVDAVRQAYAEAADEDLALADSAPGERLELLVREDTA